MSHPSSALATKLHAALASRNARAIRRRLPEPQNLSGPLIDFNSNDYLSLSTSSVLRQRFLHKINAAPEILGSGGSRLLVNGQAHSAFEARLAEFFGSEAALLFNSGFDANVGLFSSVPQPGDVVVYDQYIHASVHDGIRASRLQKDAQYAFNHNSVESLEKTFSIVLNKYPGVKTGSSNVFVAVESLYSMDGTFAPLEEIVKTLEKVFPEGNGYLIVDEAHTTGIYGPAGRGRVAQLGLEDKVLVRLHTFGKALAATGAVILTNVLIRDYLLNYARSLIYTTSLSHANIIAADSSFDLLMDGTAENLSNTLFNLSTHFVSFLLPRLAYIPTNLLSLPSHLTDPCSLHNPPSPIIPLMTSYPRPLSAYLLSLGFNARPITWPTVPKGKDRVRVCLHAGNTWLEVEKLALGAAKWAEETIAAQARESGRIPKKIGIVGMEDQGEGFVESKL